MINASLRGDLLEFCLLYQAFSLESRNYLQICPANDSAAIPPDAITGDANFIISPDQAKVNAIFSDNIHCMHNDILTFSSTCLDPKSKRPPQAQHEAAWT